MRRKPTLRNVTPKESSSYDAGDISGKSLPCPVCGNGLPVGLTFKGKPYCTCNDCGLQLFFRGKLGIERLHKLLSKATFVSGDKLPGSDPLALVNRLEKLQVQKRDLNAKQGLIFENEAVSDAISVVESEISGIEKELKELAAQKRKEK